MEPPIKKPRLESNLSNAIDMYIEQVRQCNNLRPVLGEEFDKQLPLVKVYVGHVKTPKDLSKIILTLNEKVPLKDLHHLKRVRNKEVLLCPTHFLNGMSSIQEYLEFNVPELANAFEYFKEIHVPMIAPKVKSQYNSQTWSFNFHPNKYYEKLVSDNFFSREDMKSNIIYMTMVFEVARWHLKENGNNADYLKHVNATIIVDPSFYTVVAAAFCNASHPMQHSAMLAIDNVAKTQNGGAWGKTSQESINCTLSGIDPDLLKYLNQEYQKMRFGSRIYKSRRENRDETLENNDEDGPYLCTGYDVYMLKEPCVMCSMALVHARAKRIFYCFDNPNFGGLKSRTKLQTISSLNHHFEVFTGYL